ncbi:MAG TPA: DUF5946 family protein [Actinomycetota bacterium]
MSGATTCPGCGVELPASGLPWDGRRNASPECWQLYGEVQGFELSHPELVRDCHQLAVDAYTAQHAPRDRGGAVPPIGVAYALVGLHLALDRGVPGVEVRAAHQRMGRRTRPGRACRRPGRPGRSRCWTWRPPVPWSTRRPGTRARCGRGPRPCGRRGPPSTRRSPR